jgi:hypothetical protein
MNLTTMKLDSINRNLKIFFTASHATCSAQTVLFLFFVICISGTALAQADQSVSQTNESAPEQDDSQPNETSSEQDDSELEETLPPQNSQTGGFEVQWFNPEVIPSEIKNFSRIIFSGKTVPNSRVTLLTKRIPVITKKGETKFVNIKRVTDSPFALADERGIFELLLNLPHATAQIPLEVTIPSGQSRNYQISLLVKKEEVVLTGQDSINSPYARRKWELWSGLGVNYLRYDQTITTIPSTVGFQSFSGPALFSKVVYNYSKKWAAQVTYNQSPGEASSSSDVTLTKDTYTWSYFTGELTYFPTKWKRPTKNTHNEFGLQGGLQFHTVPFFARSSATNEATTSIETNSILMGTFGGAWLMHYSRYWLFETYMRYQYPITSGSSFDIKPQFAFDGSLGAIYKWKPNWRGGLFWYGQWHKYNIENAPDAYLEANSNTKVQGSQSLFFSDLEFRIGYVFN